METISALACLTALAHETRLAVFRALVRAGNPVPAGSLAEQLELPPSTLSFHLKELRLCGLVRQERQGRQLLYQARYDRVFALRDFLVEDCCGGRCA